MGGRQRGMSFCTKCGRQRSGAELFCTKCGTPFRDQPEDAPTYVPRPDLPGTRSRRGGKWLGPVVLSVVVLAAGGGTAAWWLLSRGHATSIRSQSLVAPTGSVSVSRSAGSSSTPSPSPSSPVAPASTSITPTQNPAASTTPTVAAGLVALAPTVVQNARTARAEAFVNEYFAAINAHSYQGYDSLLAPTLAQDETPQSFYSGYRSTRDSAATINSIYATGPGQVAVTLTFVSHQLPADSATGTSCTNWNITLFLQNYSGQYLMAPAPATYHAIFSAC
jgi:hypothetical protein